MNKYFLVGIFVVYIGLTNELICQLEGNLRIDSLRKEIPKLKHDTSKVNALIDLSYTLYFSYPKESIALANEALELSRKHNFKFGESRAYSSLGVTYTFVKSDFARGLEYFLKSLNINMAINLEKGIASNYGNIGANYHMQGDTVSALEYYHKALQINKKLKNRRAQSTNLGNIGMILSSKGENEKALEYLNQALDSDIKEGFNEGIARNYGRIGLVFKNKMDFAKAFEYFDKALKINNELGNETDIAIWLSKIAETYSFLTRDSIISKLKYETNILLDKRINFEKSKYYYNQANELNKKLGEQKYRCENLAALSELYFNIGDYLNAYKLHKEYKLLNDSLFNIEKTKEIANIEDIHKVKIKDKEISILKYQNESQKLQSYLLLGGVCVMFFGFAIILYSYLSNKKLNNALKIQKAIVEEKNEHIISSINYASTIQHAILPWESTLKKAFEDVLIYYRPKDIVSGDSYWFQEFNGVKFLAVIDCTGHGIPGSMLAVIANSVLDDAIISKQLTDTAKILNHMNRKVTEVLNQKLVENKIRDGMEVAIIAIYKDKIQFSGAGRPLYIFNETMEIIKTDKRGIAGSSSDTSYTFSSVELQKNCNQTFYLTSDGFADQMNENSKKYSTKRFVELLNKISSKPFNEQQVMLDYEFETHRGSREQIDDITIIGVRI
ncbi:hypothetical protein MASR1M45_16630 [Candidatus Kapaibacterium sp.]